MDFKEFYKETFSQVHFQGTVDMEAIRHMRKRTRYRKVLLAAAVVCAFAALCITAYSQDFLGLRSFVLDSGHQETVPLATEQDTEQSIQQQEEYISLQGFADSPESMAVAEWKNFVDNYDVDGEIIASIGNGPIGVDAKYSLYTVYTQEMADKLQEIVDKYGLKLHTRNEVLSYEELAEYLGGEFTDANNSKYSGYMYEDGSFSMDGDYFLPDGEIGYQLCRFVQGSFTDIFLNIGDTDDYCQWTYITANGDRLLMALGRDKSLIISQADRAFITINVLSGSGNECEYIVTREILEQMADSVDWQILSIVSPPNFPELAIPEMLGWGCFDEVLDEIHDKAAPRNMPIYSLYDVDADGSNELIVKTTGDDEADTTEKFSVYYVDSDEVKRAEYMIFADEASLWGTAEGGFYCVYQNITYKYNLKDGKLTSDVVRSGNTDTASALVIPPSDKPFMWSMVDDRSLLSGDNSNVFTDIQDYVYFGQSSEAQRVYAAILYNLINFKIMPDGTQIGELMTMDADMGLNKFAVFDVDQDGSEELIILQLQGATAANAGVVIGYSQEEGKTHQQLWEYPMLTFYDNGVVTAGAGHNQGRGGDFWPYTLYVYDASSDTYVYVGSVDAWDKKLSDENPDVLPPFPTELDKSGSGFLYYIYAEGYDPEMLYDESVYLDWLNGYIGDAEELQVPFVSLTADNVTDMMSAQ